MEDPQRSKSGMHSPFLPHHDTRVKLTRTAYALDVSHRILMGYPDMFVVSGLFLYAGVCFAFAYLFGGEGRRTAIAVVVGSVASALAITYCLIFRRVRLHVDTKQWYFEHLMGFNTRGKFEDLISAEATTTSVPHTHTVERDPRFQTGEFFVERDTTFVHVDVRHCVTLHDRVTGVHEWSQDRKRPGKGFTQRDARWIAQEINEFIAEHGDTFVSRSEQPSALAQAIPGPPFVAAPKERILLS